MHQLLVRSQLSIAVLLVGMLVPLALVAAQAGAEPADDEDFGSVQQPIASLENTVACFDYYRFGSVSVNLTAPVSGTVSGSSITFTGSIKNENPYPIVDGALYVKVFKVRGGTNDGNGPDVVDQFFVKGDIVIPAQGSIPLTFDWRVPSYAQTGEYRIATFFTTSRKFNLLGLSFTDDVVGNTVSFRVVGEVAGNVQFDKTKVTIAGKPYLFAAFPPRVDGTEPVELAARVRNTTDTEEVATISWVVYQWDAQLRENAVQQESKQVRVPARGSADVSITVTDTRYPVYLVVGTLEWQDTRSVIGARFVREGVDRTRINFPGIMRFPLQKGEENTVFSCLHNSGTAPVVPGGRLELTLTDERGNLIHEYTYEGGISGAMMGIAEAFTPRRAYDYVVLDARLYEGDTFIDEAHLVYDCASIDPALCLPEEGGAAFLDTFLMDPRYAAGAIGAAFLAFFAIVMLVYRRITRVPASRQGFN